MRLFCDQNIPLETIAFLRSLGHDVLSTRDAGMSRAADEEILQHAIQEDRILLTFNADFSDLRVFPPGTHSGIIRLRLYEQTAEELHPILTRVMGQLKDKDLTGKLVTIKARSVRIRGA
jgi:predicted nuclease of predicted toxin-antitoxin system